MSYQDFLITALQPENNRQHALLEVQMYNFVAHEINLYLDTHPDDHNMIQLYQEYVEKPKSTNDI